MNRVLAFLRDKAFLLVLLACIVAATATSIWAIHTVRSRLNETEPDTARAASDTGEETWPGADETEGEAWNSEGVDVAGKAENVPEEAPKERAGSSGALSGSASLSVPAAELSGYGEEAAAPQPSCVSPVTGSVQKAYSGDELVYSKTLGDWRTHNGTDFGCDAGESVFAPTTGLVTTVKTDGNWGGIVELTDSKNRVWRLCGVTAAVKAGDKVVTGQTLGRAGPIGCENAEGSHIHMEIVENGAYLDPAGLLG